MNDYHSIFDELPDFYRKLLPRIFSTVIPPEDMSDCASCTMQCRGDNPLQLPEAAFYGAVKCCTYYPDLPNYLVGEILRDKSNGLGKQRILESIRHRGSSTPLGVFMPQRYKVVYDAMINTGFGKASTLACPYFDTEAENCSIWKYRNSVCSTWFCKVNARDKGKFFWETLMNYLKHIERSLSNFVLMEVGYDIHLLTQLNKTCGHDSEDDTEMTPEEVDDLPMRSELYFQIWQQWEGRELEFFATANDIVRQLGPDNLASICGVEGHMHNARLASSLQMMMYVPTVLVQNPVGSQFNVVRNTDSETGMTEIHLLTNDLTYTVPVVFRIPNRVLALFDGNCTVDEVVKDAKKEAGYVLKWETIIKLYSYDVLIDAAPPGM